MTDLINPANFDFFARYLLAGWIIIFVRSRFVIGERPRLAEALVEAVVLSLFNQMAVLVLATLAQTSGFGLSLFASLPANAAFLAEVLLLPTLLGLLAGWNLSQGWNRALLRRLAMPIEHPVRRAYDFAFTQLRAPAFLIVTYDDGTRVFGYFGANSLAASDLARSDIFLEHLYDVSQDGTWTPTEPQKSALLYLTSVRSIEFVLPGKEA